MDQVKEAVDKVVSIYEVLKTKPWYSRWLWAIAALVLGLLAALAISRASSAFSHKRQMQREARATLLRETLKAAKMEDKQKKAEYVTKLVALNKQLKEAEKATEKQEQELAKHVESIDKAKNWKELSRAMEKN